MLLTTRSRFLPAFVLFSLYELLNVFTLLLEEAFVRSLSRLSLDCLAIFTERLLDFADQ